MRQGRKYFRGCQGLLVSRNKLEDLGQKWEGSNLALVFSFTSCPICISQMPFPKPLAVPYLFFNPFQYALMVVVLLPVLQSGVARVSVL